MVCGVWSVVCDVWCGVCVCAFVCGVCGACGERVRCLAISCDACGACDGSDACDALLCFAMPCHALGGDAVLDATVVSSRSSVVTRGGGCYIKSIAVRPSKSSSASLAS